MEQKSTTIFINPKFKNAYINPNFLVPQNTTIHVNPKFLNQQVMNQASQPPLPPPIEQIRVPEPPPLTSTNKSAIIKNTKRSLIRVQEKLPAPSQILQGQSQIQPPKPLTETIEKKLNLIKISNTKLINASQLMKRQQKENETIKKATESLIKAKKLQQKKANGQKQSIYRLDRRNDEPLSSPITPKKKRKIIQQYSIRSVDHAKSVAIKKKVTIVTDPKLLKTVNNPISNSARKKYSLVMKKTKSKKSLKGSSTAQTENRYFDKDVVNSSPSSLLKNIPERSKKAPVLPDYIKI